MRSQRGVALIDRYRWLSASQYEVQSKRDSVEVQSSRPWYGSCHHRRKGREYFRFLARNGRQVRGYWMESICMRVDLRIPGKSVVARKVRMMVEMPATWQHRIPQLRTLTSSFEMSVSKSQNVGGGRMFERRTGVAAPQSACCLPAE